MGVRQFYWRDLPSLIRYRQQGQFFDSAMLLTRGPMLVSIGALTTYFASATGIFTYLCANDNDPACPLLGQVMHATTLPYARLTFLAPESALESEILPQLVEQLVKDIGERGALHLLAEVDEQSLAFESLREVSFAIYARQRVWRMKSQVAGPTINKCWQPAQQQDIIPVRSLHNSLVPAMVQQIESLPKDDFEGFVYYHEGDLQAYVEVKRGLRGIWVQPFFHPDLDDLTPVLKDLLTALNARRNQPVYICVRSYQSWLENWVEAMDAEPGPLQAVMVKHLAISKKVEPSFALQALEGRQPEATASITNRSVSNNS
jgi:hypothetical protein